MTTHPDTFTADHDHPVRHLTFAARTREDAEAWAARCSASPAAPVWSEDLQVWTVDVLDEEAELVLMAVANWKHVAELSVEPGE